MNQWDFNYANHNTKFTHSNIKTSWTSL